MLKYECVILDRT